MLFQVFVASFISGMLGAMGFGSGAVLIIWLTSYLSYNQLTAQGVNLLFFIPCAAFSLFLLWRKGFVNIKLALPVTAGGIIGILLCQGVLDRIPAESLKKLFGLFVIFIGINQLIRLKKSK